MREPHSRLRLCPIILAKPEGERMPGGLPDPIPAGKTCDKLRKRALKPYRKFSIMRICILGAGIVGLATAWELARAGHQVSIVERHQPGTGTSQGNGAQLSYAYVAPLAESGVWAQLPRLLLAPDSPLKLRPQLDPLQWWWGLRFLAACTRGASRRTTTELLALAADSRAAFEQMRQELQPDCDFSATGKLVLYRDATSLEQARRQMELQRRLGSQQQVLDPDECVAAEPTLAAYRSQIAGCVHTPGECAVDNLKLSQSLALALQQQGVSLHAGTPAQSWVLRQGRAVAVRTPAGEIEADAFVLALGPQSHAMARQLGAWLPVYPLKGYSITLDLPAALQAAAPQVSITDSARKTVFARLGQRLRVAGMAELVGHGLDIPQDRIDTLVETTLAVFPDLAPAIDPDRLQPWAGLRPATPTGLPIVGRQARAPGNVWFNTGHGALGLTLAFGTARRLAGAIRSL